MAINLSNVNISIQDFQAVSSGVFNAGDVRLTSDHSIDKVNHHVGWFFSNNTPISHAEVLTIKDAFVRVQQARPRYEHPHDIHGRIGTAACSPDPMPV